ETFLTPLRISLAGPRHLPPGAGVRHPLAGAGRDGAVRRPVPDGPGARGPRRADAGLRAAAGAARRRGRAGRAQRRGGAGPGGGRAVWVADWAGLLLALVWTAGFLPSFLEPASVSVLLAKPVPRWLVLAGKVLGVVAFVGVLAVAFVGATWLALALRTGVWDA